MSTIIKPKVEWVNPTAAYNIFPPLIYKTKTWNKREDYKNLVNDSVIATLPDTVGDQLTDQLFDQFVLGGSWNIWINEPRYHQRRLMFEELYFPYNYEFRHFIVRNATILWPRLNLYLYTSLQDPNTVFLTSPLLTRKIIAKFVFADKYIQLTEYV